MKRVRVMIKGDKGSSRTKKMMSTEQMEGGW